MTETSPKARTKPAILISLAIGGVSLLGIMVVCCGEVGLMAITGKNRRQVNAERADAASPPAIASQQAGTDSAADTLTADFLKLTPGRVRVYDYKTYDTRNPDVVLVEATQREVSKSLDSVEVEMTMKMPAPLQPMKKMFAKRTRTNGQFIEISGLTGGDEWLRLIKVGAKPGDTWDDGPGNKDVLYKFIGFREIEVSSAKGQKMARAIIERWEKSADPQKNQITLRTEFRLDAGDGVVSANTFYMLNSRPETLVAEYTLTASMPSDGR